MGLFTGMSLLSVLEMGIWLLRIAVVLVLPGQKDSSEKTH